jgi:DNA mismatch endonuclease, patch repair protein
MGRIRARDTRPELLVRSMLHRLGYRFRLHVQAIPGRPDIGIKNRRVAIFVHGCFWHQHPGCSLARMPKRNCGYWVPKLRRNVERDALNLATLEALKYHILIVWECETKSPAAIGVRLRTFMQGAPVFSQR